jgi:hypothetical protein
MSIEDARKSWRADACTKIANIQLGHGNVTCVDAGTEVHCDAAPTPCLEDTLMTPEAAYASWKDCNVTVVITYGTSNVTCFRRWWPKDVFCYAKPSLPKCALDEVMTPQETLESWEGCGRVVWVDNRENLVTCYITDFGTVRCQHPTIVHERWPWDEGFILPRNTSVGLALIYVLWDIIGVLWALFRHMLGPMAKMGVLLWDMWCEAFDLLCLGVRWWDSYFASLLGII